MYMFLNVCLQVSEGKVDTAKAIFYKALQNVPWSKVTTTHTHTDTDRQTDRHYVYRLSTLPRFLALYICMWLLILTMYDYYTCLQYECCFVSMCSIHVCCCAWHVYTCIYIICEGIQSFLLINVFALWLGFVHGRSAAVPGTPTGVCGPHDGEGTASQTAPRGVGYTTWRLNEQADNSSEDNVFLVILKKYWVKNVFFMYIGTSNILFENLNKSVF